MSNPAQILPWQILVMINFKKSPQTLATCVCRIGTYFWGEAGCHQFFEKFESGLYFWGIYLSLTQYSFYQFLNYLAIKKRLLINSLLASSKRKSCVRLKTIKQVQILPQPHLPVQMRKHQDTSRILRIPLFSSHGRPFPTSFKEGFNSDFSILL